MHMHIISDLLLVFLCCELCSSIKVPITWDQSENSEVQNKYPKHSQVEIIAPYNAQITSHQNAKPIPVQYFQYTAQKPQFASDIAAFHGVKNPQEHFQAYSITPHTGKQKPTLGVHHMFDEDRTIYQPFQKYVKKNEQIRGHVSPVSSGYEIFYPYKAEEPGLQNLYKDPVLSKIRNDVQNSKIRLQNYENEAGKPNIKSEEYLESPEQTDGKLFPQQNVPATYEIHRPERRPAYYTAPVHNPYRDEKLNKKFKHPWNQQNAKIRPLHYRPIKNHIQQLRQQHANTYDDERNEYPQVPQVENVADVPEGFDIYMKGKQKYTQLRNNVDESINQAVKLNHPEVYQMLELRDDDRHNDEENEEFVPIKNYAQVRKTETYKHLPKKAAFDDADTYEEILNAPRLREAVKSTKAQTVYSEEGYEDAAYDHAGEQKHASDHEGHGGFLKAYENSSGRYKIPSVSAKYADGKGSEYRDKTEHGKQWINDDKDNEEEIEEADYSEVEHDELVDADTYKDEGPQKGNRNKREDEFEDKIQNESIDKSITTSEKETQDDLRDEKNKDEYNYSATSTDKNDTNFQHAVDKRQAEFKIPKIDLDSTYLTESEISKLAKLKILPGKKENIKNKYPYYFQNIKGIHKHSPLRYAENLKLIPNKSNGGTEFYDSRSKFECPEVDEDIDPLPEKLKNGENPTEDDDDEDSKAKGEKRFETIKEQPRLRGLGDKIDCFKAKYFGENPLDSPFFKEELISNPEPIIVPKLSILNAISISKPEKKSNQNANDTLKSASSNSDLYELLDKLRYHQTSLQDSLNKGNEELRVSLYGPQVLNTTNNTQKINETSGILTNVSNENFQTTLLDVENDTPNVTYTFVHNNDEVTKHLPKIRKKRATPFIYEPYKIIRDGQVQDSKKTTTTGNISPLIKQLQSSKVADRVSRSNHDEKKVKHNQKRTYIDIGKQDRTTSKLENDDSATSFIDVSIDQRRGEPRYELRPSNHKSEYKPVENKRAMSVNDYNMHITSTEKVGTEKVSTQRPSRGRQRFRMSSSTVRPYYDVSQFIPKQPDIQSVAASNEIKNTVTTTTPTTTTVKEEHKSDEDDSEEDYEDDEEEEEEYATTTTTTTTTVKPIFRKRMNILTTEKPIKLISETEEPKLKLVTRFRNYKLSETKPETKEHLIDPATNSKESDIMKPKYIEKKKKTSTRTLVTDTQKYGNDDDDEMKEEDTDALIGIKQDMKDYMPSYEKEQELREIRRNNDREPEELSDEDEDEDDEDEDDDDDGDDDDDDDDDEDEDDDEIEEEEEEKSDLKEVTTPEPIKRTLPKTTDAPPPTVASRTNTALPITPSHTRQRGKPLVMRKQIEIHKELPVNKSSPHMTQFKQDIKEVEIIKQIPSGQKRKPQKNAETLELYKDDNLAKDINKLDDVEIFSEDLDLDKSPKHGGNYRKATREDIKQLALDRSTNSPKDAEASHSENTKRIELEEYMPRRLHGGNLKSIGDFKQSRNSGRSSKLIDISAPTSRSKQDGKLKTGNKRQGESGNEKLTEFDEDRDDDHSSSHDDDYEPNSSRRGRMHGGNYRSEKLVAKPEGDDIQVKDPKKEARRSAAVLLNSFIQAAPVLTTTPVYILDPSKRMYYYVD